MLLVYRAYPVCSLSLPSGITPPDLRCSVCEFVVFVKVVTMLTQNKLDKTICLGNNAGPFSFNIVI